jgi:hypothetical protein
MLVDFFKGNHLSTTTMLPWLWQARGPACTRIRGAPRCLRGAHSPSQSQRKGSPTSGTRVAPPRTSGRLSGPEGLSQEGAVAVQRRQAPHRGRRDRLDIGGTGIDGREAWQVLAEPVPTAPATASARRALSGPETDGDGRGRQRPIAFHFFNQVRGLLCAGSRFGTLSG